MTKPNRAKRAKSDPELLKPTDSPLAKLPNT